MSEVYYKEKVFSRFNTGIFAVVVVLLLFVLIYQLTVGPFGSNPPTNQTLIVIILIFAAIGVNFSTLNITINPEGLRVGYGLLNNTIPWKNIESSYLDKTSVIMYGGWGIRLGRVKGKWRLVYNVFRGPRVVLVLKKGWYREFVFSTRNPQEVMRIIGQQLNNPS